MKFSPSQIFIRASLYLIVAMFPVYIDAIKSGEHNYVLTSLMAVVAGATTLRAFIDQSSSLTDDSAAPNATSPVLTQVNTPAFNAATAG